MAKKTSDERVTFSARLDPEDAAEVERRAEAERRTVSQFLRNLIHDALRAKKEIR